MNFLVKYWPTISAVAVGLSTTDPWVRHLIAAHPEIETLAAVLAIVVAHNMTAPKDAALVNVAAAAFPTPNQAMEGILAKPTKEA